MNYHRLFGWSLAVTAVVTVGWLSFVVIPVIGFGDDWLVEPTVAMRYELLAVMLGIVVVPQLLAYADSHIERNIKAKVAGYVFVLMLASFLTIVFIFMSLWVTGQSQTLIDVDQFNERGIEIFLFVTVLWFVPVLLYKLEARLTQSMDTDQ